MESQIQDTRSQYKLHNKLFALWLVHAAGRAGYAFESNTDRADAAKYEAMADRIIEKGGKVPCYILSMLERTICLRKEVNL